MLGLDRSKPPKSEEIKHIWLPEVTNFQLSNGVKVYCIDNAPLDITRLDIVVQAGFWYQNKPLVASFTNSMLDEGTSNYTSAQIAEKFDFHGAHLKVEPGRHAAAIVVHSLTHHLPELYPILADLLKNSIFPEKEFQTIVANRRQSYVVGSQKVAVVAERDFSALLYGEEHPYGIQATLADFNKVTPQDLAAFYHTRYLPQHTYIIVSGKVPTDLQLQLEQYFGQAEWHTQQPNEALKAYQANTELNQYTGRKLFAYHENAKQTAVRMGILTPNRSHEDYMALRIASTAIGGYFGSRLMKSIREEKGYTYGIGSYLETSPISGSFQISTEVGAEVAHLAVDEIYEQLYRFLEKPMGENELTQVRNYIMGEFLRNFDGPFSHASILRNALTYKRSFDGVNKDLQIIREITATQIWEVANKYINPSEITEMLVGRF
jgi:predicted Zn-dependent peptidase